MAGGRGKLGQGRGEAGGQGSQGSAQWTLDPRRADPGIYPEREATNALATRHSAYAGLAPPEPLIAVSNLETAYLPV